MSERVCDGYAVKPGDENWRKEPLRKRIKDYQLDASIYVLQLSEKEKRRTSWVNFLYVAGVAVTQVLAGLVNQASSRTAWVVYPYLMIFLPLAYAFLGVGTYRGASCRMSSTQYQEGLLRIRRSLVGVLVLTVLGVILEVIYLAGHLRSAPLVPEFIYIGLHILQALLIISFGRYYNRKFSDITAEK